MLCKVTGAKHSTKMISVAFVLSCPILGFRRWDGY